MAGTQEKNLIVISDDAPGQPRTLGIVVELPELISIRPRLLFWLKGEEKSEKDIAIRVASAGGYEVMGVRALIPLFSARLEQPSPTTYRIHVRSTEEKRTKNGTLEIKVNGPGRNKVFLAYAAVK